MDIVIVQFCTHNFVQKYSKSANQSMAGWWNADDVTVETVAV